MQKKLCRGHSTYGSTDVESNQFRVFTMDAKVLQLEFYLHPANSESVQHVDKRFDTDKYESGYIPFYIERIKNPKRVLEVGVKNGGSLLLWCDLWPSVEDVTGIDIK